MQETHKVSKVLFRELVDLPSTTYATHGLYSYPAKFIPHVVRFVIKRYTEEGDWLFDPFAGSGTVAIEAHLTGRNYILWDINPVTEILVKASTYMDEVREEEISVDFDYSRPFIPRWSNLYYWHPKDFVRELSKAWGYWHYEIKDFLKPLAAIPLMKLTRYFSYSDEKISKLYKSKRAVEKVNRLLKSDWKSIMLKMYRDEVRRVIRKVEEFQVLNPKRVEGEVKIGDSLSMRLKKEVDVLVTSPPYLQAQEYIRSFKLELFWLGLSEEQVRRLQKLEIPYREAPNVKVESDLYEKYREEVLKLNHKQLLKIYDCYFKSLAYFLNVNHKFVRKYIAFFVGPVKVRTLRIPIDEILKEHLESLGWKHEVTFEDKIITRKLFKTKVNPATGLEDERTPVERLLVMKR